MTTVETSRTRSLTTDQRRVGFGPRFRLSWRLVRRGAALIWLTVAAYMTIEVLVFRNAYPDAASRERLVRLSTSTAVRMLQGSPGHVDTAGGFAVWDGGWMVMLIVGCWTLLTAMRLTRGEDDSGRADLALCRPVTANELLRAHLAAMGVAAAGIAAAAAAPFVVLGEPVAGAVIWGLGLAGFATIGATTGALLAQVFAPRGHAAASGLGLLAAAFVLRLVANSADNRAWLAQFGPFGWVDRLRAFADDRWQWLLAPATVSVLLTVGAAAMCERRDSGAALWRRATKDRSSRRLLGSSTGFGWRLGLGGLAAWTIILSISMFAFGLMTRAVVDFIKADRTYRRMLEAMGVDMSVPALGYLSYIAVFSALPFAVFTAFRLGRSRQEEADGRLDNLLVRGVVRWRWLTVTALDALLAAVVLVAGAGAGLWAGAALADAPVSAAEIAEVIVGTLPVVVCFTGLAVAAFGLVPRLTTILPAALAVAAYALNAFGASLSWPGPVLGISPFHHMAQLPASPMTWQAIVALTGVGAVAAAVGIAAFVRRDLRSA